MERKAWQTWSDDEESNDVKTFSSHRSHGDINTGNAQGIEGPKTKRLKKTYEDIALGDPVRKKCERNQLNGYDCTECAAYLGSFDMTEEERQERLKLCSRHRGSEARPSTPEGFWDTSMPSTPEAISKGLIKICTHPEKSMSQGGDKLNDSWS